MHPKWSSLNVSFLLYFYKLSETIRATDRTFVGLGHDGLDRNGIIALLAVISFALKKVQKCTFFWALFPNFFDQQRLKILF
jgi:hypothetical protein